MSEQPASLIGIVSVCVCVDEGAEGDISSCPPTSGGPSRVIGVSRGDVLLSGGGERRADGSALSC